MPETETSFKQRLQTCRLCAQDFANTKTAHEPRPVTWFQSSARILIAGQAPGMRVHQSGVPFDDRSGDRLRDWLGLTCATFYDQAKAAIVPMAFCFPGYDGKGADLPPPPRCAKAWRSQALEHLPNVATAIVIGRYAQHWHLGETAKRAGVTATVQDWRKYAPEVFVIPHPSWRNNAFLRKNPWFETDLLPELKQHVSALTG